MPSPQRRPTAAEYSARDLAICRFAYRYGVVLNCLVNLAIFYGKECGHVLRRLTDRNWLESHPQVLPGGLSFFRLTSQGGKQIGFELKPKKLGAVALDSAIATAFFAVIDAGRGVRQRVTPKELAAINKALPGNVPHVLTTEFEEPAILRVQLAAQGKTKDVKKKAADFFKKSRADDRLAPWLQSKQLGLTIVGHTPERVAELKRVFESDERFYEERIVVGLGPTAETLARCLRTLRNQKGEK